MEKGVDEVGSVAVLGENLAGEIADGLANHAGDNNDGDQDKTICTCGEKHWQHGVPVKNVADYDVNDSKARLRNCVSLDGDMIITMCPKKKKGNLRRPKCRPAQKERHNQQSPFPR